MSTERLDVPILFNVTASMAARWRAAAGAAGTSLSAWLRDAADFKLGYQAIREEDEERERERLIAQERQLRELGYGLRTEGRIVSAREFMEAFEERPRHMPGLA